MEPFSYTSHGYSNLLASVSLPPIDVDSPEPAANSPGLVKPLERRKWGPHEDLVLIRAWLNTSKDRSLSRNQEIKKIKKIFFFFYLKKITYSVVV